MRICRTLFHQEDHVFHVGESQSNAYLPNPSSPETRLCEDCVLIAGCMCMQTTGEMTEIYEYINDFRKNNPFQINVEPPAELVRVITF